MKKAPDSRRGSGDEKGSSCGKLRHLIVLTSWNGFGD
jgi:hypothetical protein